MTAYCVRCRSDRRWLCSASLNGDRPITTYWRCTSCGYERVQLADVADAAQLCRTVIARARQAGKRHDLSTAKLDYEDAFGELYAAVWAAYRAWDVSLSPRFLPYAMTKLRHALADWYREQLGRNLPKPLAVASSLDAMSSYDDEDDNSWEPTSDDVELDTLASADLEFELSAEGRETVRDVVTYVDAGFSYGEIGLMTGQTTADVAARVRAVRQELRPAS